MMSYASAHPPHISSLLLPSLPPSLSPYHPRVPPTPSKPYPSTLTSSNANADLNSSNSRRPKKKRKKNASVADVESARLHEDIVTWLKEGTEGLMHSLTADGRWREFVRALEVDDAEEANEESFDFVAGERNRVRGERELDMDVKVWCINEEVDQGSTISAHELYHKPILNPSSSLLHIPVRTSKHDDSTETSILLPPRSGFIMGDFTTWCDGELLRPLLPKDGQTKETGWDLILLDPPWPNASASRSSAYQTWDAYDLLLLQPPLKDGYKTLVGVWVTNRVKALCDGKSLSEVEGQDMC
ncbi:hypothetical protein BT69DRAFT_442744 [Atractiella rhizophila]|nr:hypothetical protein BT69DRAFT_442744 [Atractiella rhizophila]